MLAVRSRGFSGLSFAALIPAALVVVQVLWSPGVRAAASFQDVSSAAGVEASNESYGASWGDLNGDGCPDIFVNNHREQPNIFLNRCDGSFWNNAQEVVTWVNRATADTHGGSWVDFDNDGDQDLLVTTGTGNDQQLFVNERGDMEDRTIELGLDFSNVGGRLPLWFDYDQDGLFDVFVSQMGGNAQLFRQLGGGGFTNTTVGSGIQCNRTQYGVLLDSDSDAVLDLLCAEHTSFPTNVYQIQSYPFLAISNQFPSIEKVADSIVADFDNNGEMDVFLLSNTQLRISGIEQASPTVLEAHLTGGVKGFNFQGGGNLNVDLSWNRTDDPTGFARILVGQSAQPLVFSIPFQLDPADPDVQGVPPSDPSFAPFIRIGYDSSFSPPRWVFISETEDVDGDALFSTAYFTITGDAPIVDPQATGLWPTDSGGVPTLLLNDGTDFNDATSGSGLDEHVSCVSVTAGDYDADGDIDLYVACRNAAGNITNRYYDNQWDTLGVAQFVLVASAGGAAGPVGANVTDAAGTADSTITADFDNDGFLDLFVTNGFNLRPLEYGGPNKLFRNQGNSNHWLQLDLVGTSGTRDPVGARVDLTAGGVTQTRIVNGNYHRWSQDFRRLHFGLGSATSADLTITWPGGFVETHLGVGADTFYTATENGGIAATPPGAGVPYPCGEPSINGATESGVFVYRQCFLDAWRVRFAGGGVATDYTGRLLADAPFAAVNQSGGAPDVLDFSADPQTLIYDIPVSGSQVKGFNVTPGSGATRHCLQIDAPAGVPVYYGVLKQLVASPAVELETGEACGDLPPDVAVAPATASEGDANLAFVVTLSESAASPVTVNAATSDLTAEAGNDYTAVSTTVTFNPGEVEQTVLVPVIDDGESEPAETLELRLSSPSGAALKTLGATGTIQDNETSACGAPSFNPSTEAGIFFWVDCTTGQREVRAASGGPFTIFTGSVTSSAAFSSVSGFSLEASDTLDTSITGRINYDLRMLNAGVDGFTFMPAGGAVTCFDLPTAPAGATVYVGPSKLPVAAPFDIDTLGPCGSAAVTLDAEPAFALESDASIDFTLRLTDTTGSDVTADYTIVGVSALPGEDFSDIGSGTATIVSGATTTTVSVPLIDDSLAEGDETLRIQLSNVQNALPGTLQADGTISDDEVSPCGDPGIVNSVDQGRFIWNDCGTSQWHLRVPAGGVFGIYPGDLTSSIPWATVNPFSYEASDSLSVTSVTVEYEMRVSGNGIDGLDFAVPAGATVCVGAQSPGDPVTVGATRTLVTTPFDLATLGPCTSGGPPSVSLSGFTVDEGAGSAAFALDLSGPAAQAVAVDVTIQAGTATAGQDFTPVAPLTVTFNPGETAKTANVTLLDDGVAEGDETILASLSNPQGLVIAVGNAVGTIQDNEVSPCGEPAYSPGSESGYFLWKACDGSGEWFLRVAVGGAGQTFEGTVSSNSPWQNVTPFSIESSDILDTSTDPQVIDFSLRVFNAGVDGFDFTPATNATACFAPTGPTGVDVYVGAGRQILSTPIDLNTLAACGAVPAISVGNGTATEGNQVVFPVTLSAPAGAAVTFDYQTVDDTATAGLDYSSDSGTFVIPAGTVNTSLTVDTFQDSAPETNETFDLTLDNPQGGTLGIASVTGTILDDDTPSISAIDVDAGEADASVNVDVVLSTSSALTVTVDYATQDGVAVAGSDYTAVSGTLTFDPGVVSQSVTIPLLDDGAAEGLEQFELLLSNPGNANLTTPTVTVTINDDESAPEVSASSPTVNESDGNAVFNVTLSFASANTVTVDVATVDGEATSGSDYTAVGPATLTFDPGETSQSVPVALINDGLAEPVETFSLMLSNALNATLGSGGTATINDDDGSPTLALGDELVSETDGSAVVTVSLTPASALPITVDYASADGSAVAGQDYGAVSGTLNFAPGETQKTIPVPLFDDTLVEGDETFTVNLSNPSGAPIGTGQATVTIGDDDGIVCGEPPANPSTESRIKIWKNCATADEWHFEAFSHSGFKSYPGTIVSSTGFASFQGISFESGDQLVLESENELLYRMGISPGGVDEIQLVLNPGASTCFSVTLPAGSGIIVGSDRIVPSGTTFDLKTLGPCDVPELAVQDVTLLETDAQASINVNLSAASGSTVTVDYQLNDVTAIGGADYQTIANGTLTFEPGVTTQSLTLVPIDDALAEGPETTQLVLTNAQGAVIGDAAGVVTINDNEPSPCGTPVFDPATEAGVFLYKNCAAPNTWQVRFSSGASGLNHTGLIEADANFVNVVPFSLETGDVLDTSAPDVIDYTLQVGSGTGTDGFDFTLVSGTSACLRPSTDGGPPVYLGSAKLPVADPFRLDTLAPCVPDTDGDGLYDDEEIALGTDPNVPDSDGDSLTDGDEVNVYGTNPLLLDSDGGGADDGTEIASGTDPLQAGDDGSASLACGQPTFDPSTERGVFVWRNCPGTTYSVRVTAGPSFAEHAGQVSSTLPFQSVTPVSLEANDIIDFSTDPSVIDYIDLNVGSGFDDGFDFVPGAGSSTCVAPQTPAGVQVFIGIGKQSFTGPVDIESLTGC